MLQLLKIILMIASLIVCTSTAQNDTTTESPTIEELTDLMTTLLPIFENSTHFESSISESSNSAQESSTHESSAFTAPAGDVFSSSSATETSTGESIDEVSTLAKRLPPTSTDATAAEESTTMSVLQKWQNVEKRAKTLAKNSIKNLLGNLIESSGELNVSASCRRDAFKLIVGLREIKTWAFSFIDSSGKFIDGMLGGTMSNLGEYDQCLDIKATDDRKGRNFGKVVFTGQYCAIDIRPPLPPKKNFYKLNEVVEELRNFSEGDNIINEAAKTAQFFHFLAMRLGICVPSGCQASDIQEVVNRVTRDIMWTAKVKRCELKEDNDYTPLIIAVMTVLCFFGFLLLLGTLIEMYHYYAQKKINRFSLRLLLCFSMISNFKKLVNTKSASGNLSCLHGFRFLSISWIILAHTYLNINFQLFRGLRRATVFQKDFFFSAVVNASVAVDTFFFLGGLLTCYLTVKIVRDTKVKFSVPLYIIHRLFRLYPVYIMVIVFIYLAPILGSGPVYRDTTEGFVDACYKNWWTNLLFVNNFVNTDHICLPQSWYIACDMQLYIAALIVLLPILRWPKVGLFIAMLGTVASVVGMGYITYVNNYPPTMLFVHPDQEQRVAYWSNSYFKPYSHAGPYCIGLMMGYLLATRPKLKFSLCTRVIGWCCAIACNMAVLYGVYEWNTGRDPELLETLMYSSLHRVGWTLGVAWVVVNCATGQGGVVNYILTWKCWIPLGRLTFAAYLIHPMVQISAIGNIRMKLQTAHYFAVWIYFGHLLITYGGSFATSMLIEAPFLSLEKLILAKLAPRPGAGNPKAEVTESELHTKIEHRNGQSHGIIEDGTGENEHMHGTIGNGTVGNGHVVRDSAKIEPTRVLEESVGNVNDSRL